MDLEEQLSSPQSMVDSESRPYSSPPLQPNIEVDGYSTDANGWLHLVKNGEEKRAAESSSFPRSITPHHKKLQDVQAEYADILRGWRISQAYINLIEFIKENLLKAEGLVVDRIAIFGLGTFCSEHPYCRTGDDENEVPMTQLAHVETLLELLSMAFHPAPSTFCSNESYMKHMTLTFRRTKVRHQGGLHSRPRDEHPRPHLP